MELLRSVRQIEACQNEGRGVDGFQIDDLRIEAPARVLCISTGWAQAAAAAARQFAAADIVCHYFDLYRADRARQQILADPTGAPAKLRIVCAADFAEDEIDLGLFPLTAQGEAELVCESLEAAQQRLRIGGWLLASTDNPRDRWLHAELDKMFAAVRRYAFPDAVVYLAQKAGPLKRVRKFASSFAFRDRGRLFSLMTRPGVFAHRQIDPGARHLINAIEVQPGERVLDLGCGSGVVAVALAARAERVQVFAVDSHARAVECTAVNAAANGLANIVVEHSATGPSAGAPFDLVAANPPYYAGLGIAQFFLETAQAQLRRGGRIVVVMKQPAWYAEQLPRFFRDVEIVPAKQYWIAHGRK
ncbi:MAG TPA: methyltransferase [Pirellulales bacterium]|jgi:16S rRNA (guanine1207-N2)-methyltransferase|nr:methyltransferase [Pirellulales bacterium]